nr:uncharacterized protein LOC121114039 isoform X2 [Lepeophtheirus salmonis]
MSQHYYYPFGIGHGRGKYLLGEVERIIESRPIGYEVHLKDPKKARGRYNIEFTLHIPSDWALKNKGVPHVSYSSYKRYQSEKSCYKELEPWDIHWVPPVRIGQNIGRRGGGDNFAIASDEDDHLWD